MMREMLIFRENWLSPNKTATGLNLLRCIRVVAALMLLATRLPAQEGNVWIFGRNAGLDFNSGVPVPITSAIETIEGSASVCDASGQLLFYTEGSTIWDRNGNPMPNGTELTGLVFPNYSPTASTTQSSLIVPLPGDPNLYYVFSLTDGTILSKHNLYYSVVDMRLNNGLGDVVPGKKGILIDSALSEKLTGTVGKCCNIWVVVNHNMGSFHAFEITAAGLNTTPVVSPSGIANRFSYNYGEIKFSPDGNRLAAVSQPVFGLKLYDFDGYTGKFDSIRSIVSRDMYGVCFSPDNNLLYAAAGDSLYQYDLTVATASAVAASETALAPTGGLTNVKLGPDGRIYFQGRVGLSIVHYPNLRGPACFVEPGAIIPLNGTALVYGGLSNEVPVLRMDTAAFTRRDTSVCFRDSLMLIAPSPACSYRWQGGSTDAQYIARQSDIYVVQYNTPSCVFHSDTISVYFAARAPSSGGYGGCDKDSTGYLYLQPGQGDAFPHEYIWRDSFDRELRRNTSTIGDTLRNINPGVYTVQMRGNGCDTIIKLSLEATPEVTLGFSTDTIVCLGDTSFLLNTSKGYDHFLWLLGDGDTATSVDTMHVFREPGIYRVSLIGYPCEDTFTRTVTVDSAAYLRFATDRDAYCLGAPIAFSVTYPPGIVSIDWDYGDEVEVPELRPRHAYDRVGTYIIRARAHFRACADTSAADTVTIHPLPLGEPPLWLQSAAASQSGDTYRWSTGATEPGITVAEPGKFWLTVTNQHGCITTDTIEIRRSCYIDIPNVFTPNGDGVNDYFFPRDLYRNALSAFRMRIYDRWGQLLFETTNIAGSGWDGRYNGQPQPQGVYVYLVEADFANGVREKYQGNVTLLR
jgi:gliding motility-associated-like protein